MNKAFAALALSLVVGGASAATSSSVTIGQPVFTFADLDPADGIAPAYAPGAPLLDDFYWALRPAPVGSQTVGAAIITHETETSVGGATTGPGGAFLAIGDRYVADMPFFVTPNTRVTVSTTYELFSSIAGEPQRLSALAQVHASFDLTLVAANNVSFDEVAGTYRYDMLPTEGRGFVSFESSRENPVNGTWRDSGVLSMTFENRSDGDAVFAFRGEMVAWGNSPEVTPVPEASTFATMALGLALVAFARQRSGRHRDREDSGA